MPLPPSRLRPYEGEKYSPSFLRNVADRSMLARPFGLSCPVSFRPDGIVPAAPARHMCAAGAGIAAHQCRTAHLFALTSVPLLCTTRLRHVTRLVPLRDANIAFPRHFGLARAVSPVSLARGYSCVCSPPFVVRSACEGVKLFPVPLRNDDG